VNQAFTIVLFLESKKAGKKAAPPYCSLINFTVRLNKNVAENGIGFF
jgi:hypothetical protein